MRSLSTTAFSLSSILALRNANGFASSYGGSRSRASSTFIFAENPEGMSDESVSSAFPMPLMERRESLFQMIGGATAMATAAAIAQPSPALAEESIFAPKFVQEYPDFTQTDEGWSYKDVKVGDGASPQKGDRVVYEWSGYTIGYFGRPFEAKGGPKGGAFDKELDFSRSVIGSGSIVKGLECAFTSMKPGGIRQVIVPYGELNYPADDSSHDRVGPKPTTFSGMRALNFVLDNPRVDRTMLFNVKLVRVDKPDGKGGFLRGDKRS